MVRDMGKASWFIIVKGHMKVDGLVIINMVKVYRNFQMDVFMKGLM